MEGVMESSSFSHNFAPMTRAWERVNIEVQDSEAAAFHGLLYLGELIVKMTSVAFASGVQSDPERKQYAIEYRLVRASGVGDHVSALDEMLIGPTYELLHPGLHQLQKQLVTKCVPASPGAECLSAMVEAMSFLGIEPGGQAPANTLRAWFHWFVQVRNKTRGHGAPMSEKLAAAYPSMRRAMILLSDNLDIFRLPWVFVRRNLSGKYRTVLIGGNDNASAIAELRSGIRKVDRDGVYLVSGEFLSPIRLFLTDADLSDLGSS